MFFEGSKINPNSEDFFAEGLLRRSAECKDRNASGNVYRKRDRTADENVVTERPTGPKGSFNKQVEQSSDNRCVLARTCPDY